MNKNRYTVKNSHIATRLLVSNWWSFHNTVFDMSKFVVNLLGHNGAGKTTIVDAITLILYGEDVDKLNFTSPQKRHVAGAMHWGIKSAARRPGKVYSYIILEARDSNGRVYHQGIRYMSKAGSEKVDGTLYFWGEGTLESINALNPAVTDAGEVITDRAHSSSDKNASFRVFYERRGYRESFRTLTAERRTPFLKFKDMNRSILNNSKIKEAAFSEYLKISFFPQTSTGDSYHSLSKTIHDLDELNLQNEQNREKEQFLTAVYAAGKNYLDTKSRYLFQQRIAPYINIEYYGGEVKRLSEAIRIAEQQEAEAVARKKIVDQERDELIGKKSVIENADDPEKEALSAYEKAVQERERCEAGYEKHKEYLFAADDLRTLVNDADISLSDTEILLESSRRVRDQMEKEQETLVIGINDKRREINANNEAIRSLTGKSAGDTNNYVAQLKADAEALKNAIEREFPEASPAILYECIEKVRDEAWQDAVEGLIGNNRFGIIVRPDYYNRACAVQHRFSGNRKDSIVLNTMISRPAKEGSVPSLLVCSSEIAERYINSAYGSYILCDTDEEYATSEYALRCNGQYKVPGRSIKPGSTRKVVRVFGRSAMLHYVEELQEKNRRLEMEVNQQNVRCMFLKDTCRRITKQMRTVHDYAGFASDEHERLYSLAKEWEEMAEKELIAVRSSDAASKKKEAIEKIMSDIAGKDEEQARIDEEIRVIRNRKENAVKDRSSSKDQLDSFRKAVSDYNYPEPSEADWERVRDEDLSSTFRGKVNANSQLDSMKYSVKAARSAMENTFASNRGIMDRFTDFPESILTDRDLDRVGDELNKVTDLLFERSTVDNLRRLRYSLENNYCTCLQNMYQEYKKAAILREDVNRILSRYQIGQNFYRLGPVLSIKHDDVDVLELAKLQSEKSVPLNEEQIRALNDVCRKGFENNFNPFDYTQYITTELQYKRERDTAWKNADSASSSSSNGQQGILRYLLKIIVMYSQVFNDNKSLNFIITDEVLQGIDDTNSRYFFDILRELGVQSVISSFEDRFAEYPDYIYEFETKDDNVLVHVFRNRETDDTDDVLENDMLQEAL